MLQALKKTGLVIVQKVVWTLLVGICGGSALAQIAAPSEKVPTDMRRTTILVSDIDASLKLYRDVLGFKINYDSEVTMGGVALPAGVPGAKARLVLLNGNDGWVGWIGLLQWKNPPLDKPAKPSERMGIGGVVLVMNTDDAQKRCAEAKKLPGIKFTGDARIAEYPGRNKGDPVIRVMGCNFFDPEGTVLIELNQILK
jgi:catechol 2,3-dioxygenase-like lactoylglutathione lyase family enzyme